MVRLNSPQGLSALSDAYNVQDTVSINVAFRKINDINTIQDRFSADVFVQASWREPRLDGQSQQVLAAIFTHTTTINMMIY